MPEDSGRKYTQDEMAEILRRALERQQVAQGHVTHAELVDAAREVGIDTTSIEQAAMEVARERGVAVPAVPDERQRVRLRGFFRHAGIYAIVIAALCALDLLTSGGVWWFFPAIGWGIGLAIHGLNTFFPGQESPEQRARRELREARREERRRRLEEKVARRAAKTAARERLRRGADEFERVVEAGVASLLENLSDKMKKLPQPPTSGPAPGIRVDASAPPARGAAHDAEIAAQDPDGLHARRR